MDSGRSNWHGRRTHTWICLPTTSHAVHSVGILAEEVGLETGCEDSVFRAPQGGFVGTLAGVMFGVEDIGVETAETAFFSETQNMTIVRRAHISVPLRRFHTASLRLCMFAMTMVLRRGSPTLQPND